MWHVNGMDCCWSSWVRKQMYNFNAVWLSKHEEYGFRFSFHFRGVLINTPFMPWRQFQWDDGDGGSKGSRRGWRVNKSPFCNEWRNGVFSVFVGRTSFVRWLRILILIPDTRWWTNKQIHFSPRNNNTISCRQTDSGNNRQLEDGDGFHWLTKAFINRIYRDHSHRINHHPSGIGGYHSSWLPVDSGSIRILLHFPILFYPVVILHHPPLLSIIITQRNDWLDSDTGGDLCQWYQKMVNKGEIN